MNDKISYKSSGHSLVELMVSLFIATIIFGGVLSVVQTSRTSFVNEEESSFIQENVRYAVEIISRDIRLAGSFGCADMVNPKLANVISNTHSGLFSSEAIDAYDGTEPSEFPAVFSGVTAGTDAIILRYADPDKAIPVASHGISGFTTHTDHEFKNGDNLVVVDSSCRHLSFFQNTSGATDAIQHTSSSADNCVDEIYADGEFDCVTSDFSVLASKYYESGSELMPFVANAYYVSDSNVIPGMPALKRRSLTATGFRADELAQGVESMTLLFGVDTDTPFDGDIDVFLNASDITEWSAVQAVRFSLVFRSQSEVFDTARTVTVGGTDFSDRFLRQVASSTVRMRNR